MRLLGAAKDLNTPAKSAKLRHRVMQSIEPPDAHFLSAAVGWLQLGNLVEAKAELGQISPALATHGDVLEVKLLIQIEEKNWATSLQTARSLIETQPDRALGWLHQAYALRRLPEGGLQAAWDALLPAAERFPKEPILPYNLSCYACQLGKLDEARQLLRRAFQIGDKHRMKTMAQADADLQPLWPEIKEW